jgi:hypothetical protein
MSTSARNTQKDLSNILTRLTALIMIVLLTGCAFKVKLVGEYDEITDKAFTDLQKKTASFFYKLKTSSGADISYEANMKFYEDAQGDVSALILRAQVIEEGLKRNPMTKNFNDLQKQYDDLAILHKTAPPKKAFESAEKAFDQSFRAILENLLYLKWNQTQPDAKKQ